MGRETSALVSTDLVEALARRRALVRHPAPEGVTAPPMRYLLGELADFVHRRRKAADFPPAQRPQPVMLLPGFAAHPLRMARMERALAAAGHRVYPWGLGFNLGPTEANFAFMMRRVAALARTHGQRVALVGWSLGGLYARELARRQPQHVAKVITMGSPFSGDIHANHAWRAYELITGYEAEHPPIACDFATKPPVPTIALWSPRDGIVSPRAACGRRGERDRAVALRCTHLGFGGAPEVIAEVLRQLDYDD